MDGPALLKAARAAGCDVVHAKRSSHVKVLCPNGAVVTVGGTSSDWRAMMNARADLRRYGGLTI